MTNVTLDAAQLARLEAAIIRRPGRKFVDQGGITRVTAPVIDEFVSSLVRYHRKHGHLTERQFAAVKDFIAANETQTTS